MRTLNYDYIIIGSGIAGLTAANHLSKFSKTAMLTKNIVKESATQYAQGGIAAAMGKDDTPRFHLEDTVQAGDGLCNESSVEILVEEGPKRVQELIEIGICFDKNGSTYDFTQEAAHRKRRILHAGDATGREIEHVLGQTIRAQGKVDIFENTAAYHLLVSNNRCYGCLAIQNGEDVFFNTKAIILATGGCCQVFSKNTNPPVATGDGIAMAYAAGAILQDMEFVQFHPTTLYTGDKKPISLFLISEAVRGEGAILRNQHGDRFMTNYHNDAELAPRNIVAQAIFREMKKDNANHVFLDLSGISTDIATRFPTIYKRCLEAKIDITRDFIPVAPAAHYCMGGIKTDINGLTNIRGLYAVGEVADTGIHGANRLASNSLLDGLVFGFRATQHALKECTTHRDTREAQSKYRFNEEVVGDSLRIRMLAIKQEIRDLMWENVGIIRNEKGLRFAIKELLKYKDIMRVQTHKLELREIQNMWLTSLLMSRFALRRKESRGGHFREDFPNKDDLGWKRHLTFHRAVY